MYSIFIKYNNTANRPLYEQYGISSSTTGSASTIFKPFETDDVTILETEIAKIIAERGNSEIRIVKDVEITYGVDVVDDEETTTDPDNVGGDPTTP